MRRMMKNTRFTIDLAPEPVLSRIGRSLGCWSVLLVAAFFLAALSPADAQTVIGRNQSPDVIVNNSVLDSLGPAPTLPELFGGPRPVAPTIIRKKYSEHRPITHRRVVRRKPVQKRPMRVVHAHRPIRLTPPAAKLARAAPATAAPTSKAESATSLSPPMPKVPHSIPIPAMPDLKASPPPVEAENPPKQPEMPPKAAAALVPTSAAVPQKSAPSAATPASQTAPVVPAVPQQAPSAVAAAAPSSTTTAPVSAAAAVTPAPSSAPRPAVSTAAANATPNNKNAATPNGTTKVASAANLASALTTIDFAPKATDLPAGAKPMLDKVAGELVANNELRVELIAHASGTADQSMEARRVSLARAIAVRAYLIDKGVGSLRMDVRALGNRSDEGPATDQVDVLVVNQ